MKFRANKTMFFVIISIILISIYLINNNFLYNRFWNIFSKISSNPIHDYFDHRRNLSCINNIGTDIQSKNIDYNFFVAGHVYGSPYSKNVGIYPRFYNYMKNNDKKYDFAIFAGDITRVSNVESWNLFKKQLDELDIKKYYVAPGNHDIGINKDPKRINKFNKYFNKVNFSFTHQDDLFIILDGFENKWSRKKKQLKFLVNLLKKNKSKMNNVFIITHPPIFYRADLDIKINADDGIGKDLNFWKIIYPILNNYNQNYYLIAGDFGAFKGPAMYCKKIKNFHFIGTGMGGGTYDNFIEFTKIKNSFKATSIVF